MSGWPGILLAFGGVTAGLLWLDAGPASALRHLYLAPTLWTALRFGGLAGGAGGLLAALLWAPFVLPSIERRGLTAETLEGLVGLGLFLFVGSVTGALAGRARAEAARYRLLVELEERLAGRRALRSLMDDVAEALRGALGARAVTIVLASEEAPPLVVARGAAPAAVGEESVVAWVLRGGGRLFVSDLGSDGRFRPPGPRAGPPRRALLVPLGAPGAGVLGVERQGEFPRELRATVETLGLQLALGLENARLAERQRRFAEELEEKVAAATWRLRELDRAKSDFISIVSHELRTPLTAIQGFSELLLSRPAPPETARHLLEMIHREGERLGRIVADLLDLSRIERGGAGVLARAPVALGPLIDANLELFAGQSRAHTFAGDVSAAVAPVLADRDALDRVLKNLLSNAVRYSPGGGRVRVWAHPTAEDPERIELGVEDAGVGIPPDALSRIFEKYSRVAHPGTAHVAGLGLGLALVRALVEAQDGRIRVESEVGVGSRFIVTLPAAPWGAD